MWVCVQGEVILIWKVPAVKTLVCHLQSDILLDKQIPLLLQWRTNLIFELIMMTWRSANCESATLLYFLVCRILPFKYGPVEIDVHWAITFWNLHKGPLCQRGSGNMFPFPNAEWTESNCGGFVQSASVCLCLKSDRGGRPRWWPVTEKRQREVRYTLIQPTNIRRRTSASVHIVALFSHTETAWSHTLLEVIVSGV